MNYKTQTTTKFSALDKAGNSIQYKNYVIYLNQKNDFIHPTTLSIFNMANGKVVKTIPNCTCAKIISGKIYYATCKLGKGSSDSIMTVYRRNINGTGTTRLAQYKGNYMAPALGTTYGYFYKNDSDVVKYYYSSKKSVKATYKELSALGQGIW
jgi:hypothetical protein